MRFRPHFGDTRTGILTVGLGGAVICGLTSAAMFLFRPFCEPILRLALITIAKGVARTHLRYDPAQYYLWAGYVGFLGVFILGLAAVTIVRKPAQDRVIDQALRRQTTEFANGAPLEPKH